MSFRNEDLGKGGKITSQTRAVAGWLGSWVAGSVANWDLVRLFRAHPYVCSAKDIGWCSTRRVDLALNYHRNRGWAAAEMINKICRQPAIAGRKLVQALVAEFRGR